MKELKLASKDIIIATLNEFRIPYDVGFDVERGARYEYISGGRRI